MLDKWQTITGIKNDPIYWNTEASLGLKELQVVHENIIKEWISLSGMVW